MCDAMSPALSPSTFNTRSKKKEPHCSQIAADSWFIQDLPSLVNKILISVVSYAHSLTHKHCFTDRK